MMDYTIYPEAIDECPDVALRERARAIFQQKRGVKEECAVMKEIYDLENAKIREEEAQMRQRRVVSWIRFFQKFAPSYLSPECLGDLIQHMTDHVYSPIKRLDGRMVSPGTHGFWKIAETHLETCFETFPREEAELADYPLVKLPTTHEGKIVAFTQADILDTLFGLEWHVMSDIFFSERTRDWAVQIVELFWLVLVRCIQLGLLYDDVSHLNAEEYHKVDEYTAAKVKKAIVDWSYFFDVEAIAMNFLLELSHTQIFNESVIQAPMYPETYRAAQRVTDYVKAIQPDNALTKRRLWFENLICVDSYRRMHLRRNIILSQVTAREALVNLPRDQGSYDDRNIKDAKLLFHVPIRVSAESTTMRILTTDAMFAMKAAACETGDPLKLVMPPGIKESRMMVKKDEKFEPTFPRDYFMQRWLWQDHTTKEWCEAQSMMVLFIHFRKRCLESPKDMKPFKKVKNQKIHGLDSFLFTQAK
jgi:hypothetical protein